MPVFWDSETCGFHGPMVLLQYAWDRGAINLHSVWTEPVYRTMELIESIVNSDSIGFNMAFDWFHLCQLYTTLALFKDWKIEPIDRIEEYAANEPAARDGLCLKPRNVLDLMIHARKGPYQSTMDRKKIQVRRIPKVMAEFVQQELEKQIKFKDIYFARRKTPGPHWQITEIKDGKGSNDFVDIVCSFAPSTALKVLAVDALGRPFVRKLSDMGVSEAFSPMEKGYAPFALAVSNPEKDWRATIGKESGYAWPRVIQEHISYWTYNDIGRSYAYDDVVDTRDLHYHFGEPELSDDDDDSTLTCMVGAARWKGFHVNIPLLKELKAEAESKIRETPIAPGVARVYLEQVLDETEKTVVGGSTSKEVLDELATWKMDCCSDTTCAKCAGTGFYDHPVAIRAREIKTARGMTKEVELFDKLIEAGRFHASFKVTGTLSNRMAGADDLNPQAIKKEKRVRRAFYIAFVNEVFSGGDFSAFEVSLAEAIYADPELRKALLAGKKIHALFGVELFPGKTYEQIVASEGTNNDIYTKSKSAFFSLIYGGDEGTISRKQGVPIETARIATVRFQNKYKGIGEARKLIFNMFCSMQQPDGIGTQVIWNEPADYIESKMGFKRYFQLENSICKVLFNLANNPPKEWRSVKVKVTRREREQTASGAAQSALYSAAFGIQASNLRAAGNHVIQCWGAQITKRVQRPIWDLQPTGISSWKVRPINIHDEILTASSPEYVSLVKDRVAETIATFKKDVPLIKMDWKTNLETWADKGR